MQLDLDRQEHGRSEIDISGTLTLELGEGYPAEAAVVGLLEVQNLESRFLVRGELTASGTTQCGRCLGDFVLQWPVPVEIMVLRDVDSDEQDGVMLVIHQRQGVVELQDALREFTVLAYPQSPVCAETCRGLCASCGADLNHESCDCSSDDYDPRWDGLPE